MIKVFLSPSNQKNNKYAYGNVTEDIVCGKVAQSCKEALERCGITVGLNHYGTLAEKCQEVNTGYYDAFISIHTNSYDEFVSGTRIFTYGNGANETRLAQCIFDVLAPYTPGNSENIQPYPELYEMRMTNMAACLVEIDFHSVPSVAKWLIEHTREIGEKIAEGVCNYFGVPYKESAPAISGEIYRIRKSWNDAKSQIGAYKNLENAKKVCPSGYYVFNNAGNAVYPVVSNPSIDYAQSFDKSKARNYMVVPDVGLHLRAGAGTNKRSLQVLEQGAVVTCYGYYTNEWYLVQTSDGKVGYVCSIYLK